MIVAEGRGTTKSSGFQQSEKFRLWSRLPHRVPAGAARL